MDESFLSGLSDEDYDQYMNYRIEMAEIADHVALCTKAERDEYCKICLEY